MIQSLARLSVTATLHVHRAFALIYQFAHARCIVCFFQISTGSMNQEWTLRQVTERQWFVTKINMR